MNLYERYIFRSAVIADCKELAEMEKIVDDMAKKEGKDEGKKRKG